MPGVADRDTPSLLVARDLYGSRQASVEKRGDALGP
jgi:hypothetical protein